MRQETEKKTFVNIKSDASGYPKFMIGEQSYGIIGGILRDVAVETKTITPKTGTNAGKEITINNLLLDIVDEEWEMEVQIPLYSSLARTVLNWLAGKDPIDEVYLSVYNNKKWFRSISIKKIYSKEITDSYTPLYNWEEEIAIMNKKPLIKVKWEEKKDYDWLSDDYVKEMLPIIKEKIKWKIIEEKNIDNDELPF